MKPYWKVTLWYLAFGAIWIFLSDKVTAAFAHNVEFLTFLQTIKGWCYVLFSGLLIFHITKKAFNEALAKDREKLSIFRQTVQGVYHILLNYLNQMQVVTMEAERSQDFDKEILVLSKDISTNAVVELMKLNEIGGMDADPPASEVQPGLENFQHRNDS